MHRDTDIGEGGARFPETRHSVVGGVASEDSTVRDRAWDTLIRVYWKPVYKHLRIRWRSSNEDAKDLTQGFFARLLEKELVQRFDPSKARFRTYLRVCLDGWVANKREAAGRLKRGGAFRHVPLDFESAEGELVHHDVAVDTDPDEQFQREWTRSLLALAVEDLREVLESSGRERTFRIFRRYDLEGPTEDPPPTYGTIATELGVEVTTVTNALHATRRKFRELLLRRLRESCGSEEEFRSESRELFAAVPPGPRS